MFYQIYRRLISVNFTVVRFLQQTDVRVNNAFNDFIMLANTQFVENVSLQGFFSFSLFSSCEALCVVCFPNNKESVVFKQRVYDEDVAQEETEADKKEKQVSHFCQFMNKLLPVFSFP